MVRKMYCLAFSLILSGSVLTSASAQAGALRDATKDGIVEGVKQGMTEGVKNVVAEGVKKVADKGAEASKARALQLQQQQSQQRFLVGKKPARVYYR
jgi:hypothetical protein